MAALKGKHPKKAQKKKPVILIYGKAGVGKTWAALDFPSVYYIDCEGGATIDEYTDKLEQAGGVYMGPEDGANDMATVVEQVMALSTTDHDYKTLVIDSYSSLFNTAIQNQYTVMEKQDRDMSKTFGAEKKPAIGKSRQMVAWLKKINMNVILICHEKSLWKDGEQIGETFDGWEKLEYELDLVLQIIKQGTARKARVGKCRLSQFREGELVPWSYQDFASRYGIEVIESESQHLEPASAEQIRIVQELADVVKFEDDQRVKWFSKAGVNSWGEMDSETIAKCISALKGRLPESAA